MKYLVVMLALAIAAMTSAFAADSGGVAGYVIDLSTGKPIANVAVAIYRMPLQPKAPAIEQVSTDRNGFFANITLDPGRYLVTANVMGRMSSCVIDDVFGGYTTKIKIEVGVNTQKCLGPRVHSAIVNPSQTTDVYIIR